MGDTETRISLERIRHVAADVGRESECRLIVLFGSAARNQPSPEDLDFAVLARGRLDAVEFTNRLIRALGVQSVDVSDLSRAEPLLLMLVAREGIPLYEENPGDFACFISLAARRFADTRKFREMERREIHDFLARERPAP